MKKNTSYKNNVRVRNWFLLTYESPSVCIPDLLKEAVRYAYIFHDKDEGKEPHYHVLVMLRNAKSFSAVLRYNVGSQNVFAEPCYDLLSAFKYLTHALNKDKFQYDLNSIVSNDIAYFNSLDDTVISPSGEKTLQLLLDIIADKPYRYMVLTYGRDFVIYEDTYRVAASRLRSCDDDVICVSNSVLPF